MGICRETQRDSSLCAGSCVAGAHEAVRWGLGVVLGVHV